MTSEIAKVEQRPSDQWGAALSAARPDERSQLVPVGAAQAVIAEVDAELARLPTEDEVRKMLRRLLGAYRAGQVQDQEIYAELLREELAGAPRRVGAKAITAITRRLKWPPTRAELVEAIEEARAGLRALRYRAMLHLAEHERRAEVIEERRRMAAERANPEMRARVDALLAGFRSVMGGDRA